MEYPKVTIEDFDASCEELERISKTIRDSKRGSYTRGSENVLANFDDAATRRNISPEQVIMIFFDKQYAAIDAYFSHGIQSVESMESRFADANNYLKILWASYRRRFPHDGSSRWQDPKED